MFSLFMRRDGLIDPPAFGEVDSHCHVLPGLDDGAPDERTALAISRVLVEMGVRTVVATPHVISDVYPNSTLQILEKCNNLRASLKDHELPLTLIPGAEYYVEKELLSRIERDDLLCFGEDRCVLFEAPIEHEPLLLDDVVFQLKSAGYTPVLAHVERYRYLHDNPDRVVELRRQGVKIQVNHPSFFLPKTSRRGEAARRLYVKGQVDLLGTDMHRATAEDVRLVAQGDHLFFARMAGRS
ncbi:MAG: histidinol-phosphatase [Myxococcota bacterium]|nr:histidinol-phosphatase [Myxococcota bacterium]